jgi:hypothetical protein
MNEDILNINLEGRFPIPGSSLTADPDNPAPHDRPPQYTNLHKAVEHIFTNTIQDENYVPLIELLAKGFPLMEIVQTVLFQGFYGGKWNHSLMLLLIEPTTYIFLALAERAGIDPVFFRDDVEDDLDEEEILGVSFQEEKIERIQEGIEQNKKPHPAISDQMVAQLNEIPPEKMQSILAKQENTEEEPEEPEEVEEE